MYILQLYRSPKEEEWDHEMFTDKERVRIYIFGRKNNYDEEYVGYKHTVKFYIVE